MSLDLCGIRNPDVPSIQCDLPAGHGRAKDLWKFGQWFDHMSRSDDSCWVIPPNDERDEAIIASVSSAMAESVDFLDLLVQGLIANGYDVTRRKNAGLNTGGAHAGP